MSRLQLHGRPWVVFNAKDKEHRKWFADFNKSGAWGGCPVRFVVNDDHGDLITQIQRELIAHYVSKEFSQLVTVKRSKSRAGTKILKIDTKSKV
jgi:hypothetical protein